MPDHKEAKEYSGYRSTRNRIRHEMVRKANTRPWNYSLLLVAMGVGGAILLDIIDSQLYEVFATFSATGLLVYLGALLLSVLRDQAIESKAVSLLGAISIALGLLVLLAYFVLTCLP